MDLILTRMYLKGISALKISIIYSPTTLYCLCEVNYLFTNLSLNGFVVIMAVRVDG